jgi:hypothetical protein
MSEQSEPIRWPVEFTSDKLFKNLERERMVTDLATLRRKLEEKDGRIQFLERMVKTGVELLEKTNAERKTWREGARSLGEKNNAALRVAGELADYIKRAPHDRDCAWHQCTREDSGKVVHHNCTCWKQSAAAQYRALAADGPPTNTVTLTAKLEGLTKEIRTIMAIAPDDRANPGCACQRCRIIRALTDGAAGVEGNL